jgi:hypothetical protein
MQSSRVCGVLAAGAFVFAAMALTAPAAVATPFSDTCVITHGWNSVVVAAGIEECYATLAASARLAAPIPGAGLGADNRRSVFLIAL